MSTDDTFHAGHSDPDETEDTAGIRMVTLMLVEALRVTATRIDMTCREDEIVVRYWAHGNWIPGTPLPKVTQSGSLARLRDMAGMRGPVYGHGHMYLAMMGNGFHVASSVQPTTFGEAWLLYITPDSWPRP